MSGKYLRPMVGVALAAALVAVPTAGFAANSARPSKTAAKVGGAASARRSRLESSASRAPNPPRRSR